MKSAAKKPIQSNTALRITPSPSPLVQLKCACGGSAGLAGKCEACRRKELNGHIAPLVQAKLKISRAGDKYEQEADQVEETVARTIASTGPPAVSADEPAQITSIQRLTPILDQQLPLATQTPEEEADKEKIEQLHPLFYDLPAVSNHSQITNCGLSPGRPLSQDLRRPFELHFGYDFSQVRIHTDQHTEEIAQRIGARAFTVGRDIGFAQGEYRPDDSGGRRLLAHELTHVVQQSGPVPIMIQRKAVPDRSEQMLDASTAVITTEPSADEAPETKALQAAQTSAMQDHIGAGLEAGNNPISAGGDTATFASELKSGDQSGVAGNADRRAEGSLTATANSKADVMATMKLPDESDRALVTFLNGSASQIAATYPRLGRRLGQNLVKERDVVAETMPSLEARMSGGEQQLERQSRRLLFKLESTIDIEPQLKAPPRPKLEPHQDRTPPPKNQQVVIRLPEPDVSRDNLQADFSDAVRSIATHDPGLEVRIVNRPVFETSGRANPNRATAQAQKGREHMRDQMQRASVAIKQTSGETFIQAQQLQESIAIPIAKQDVDAPNTPEQKTMVWYVHTSIPDDVRQTVDARLLPADRLAEARQAAVNAGQIRDTDQQNAIREVQARVDEQNELANREQQAAVGASLQNIEKVKRGGLKESRAMLSEFEEQTRLEEEQVSGDVQDQINTVETQVDQNLSQAERDAAAEKAKSERQATAKQQELVQNSQNQSWWEQAVSAVKQAFEAVTKFIDDIFTKLRQKVKRILDGAKRIAIGLIEKGQKWVVDKLDRFGTWLKAEVNHFVARRFPQIARAINKGIDSAIESAQTVINRTADVLKNGVAALADTLGRAVDKVLSLYQAALKTAVSMAGAILTGDFSQASRTVFETALALMGAAAGPFMDILRKAGETINNIIDDPIGFLKNILAALSQGFGRFSDNIVTHLKTGFMGWLFGAMANAGIQVPEKFDLPAIFSLVLQVLRITKAKIEAKVVKIIGPKNVERVKQVLAVVSTVMRDGLGGLWEEAKTFLGDLQSLVIEEIKSWVITKIITQAVIKLASMFNPVGAIVQAIQTIYNVIMFVVERMQQIAALVKAVTSSLCAIAMGQVQSAAIWIEKSLARVIPVAISFLARFLGLSGIAAKIQNIIRKIQKRVDLAIDKVLKKIMRGIKGVFGKIKAGARASKEKLTELIAWWKAKKKFKSRDGIAHTLFFTGKDQQAKLTIASKTEDYVKFIRPYTDKRRSKYNPNDCDIAMDALKIAAKINLLRGKRTTTDDQRRKRAESIQEKLNELAKFTGKLAEAREKDPPSVIKYGSLGKDGRGTWMDAKILSRSHAAGSKPRDNPDIWWRHVGRRRPKAGKKSTFVQGHLLNDWLGGPGRAYNLTPITESANRNHEQKVENPIWQIVVNGGVVRYSLKPIYTGTHTKRTAVRQALRDQKARSSSQKTKKKLQKKLDLVKYEEENLAREFAYDWHELTYDHNKKEWDDKIRGEGKKDAITNELPNDEEFDIVDRK